MWDKKRLYRKVLLNLLSHPITLCPFVAGVMLLIGMWAFTLRAGILIFMAICLILAAVGIFLTRLLVGSEKVVKNAIDELQAETHQEREASLDRLAEKLKETPGREDENFLKELRALAKTFKEGRVWMSSINSYSSFDIVSKVEELFNACIKYLERTFELWKTARKMETELAKKPLLTQRDRILEDVKKSIEQLVKILEEVGRIGLEKEESKTHLGHLREELNQSLEIAKRTEERINEMGLGIGVDIMEKE